MSCMSTPRLSGQRQHRYADEALVTRVRERGIPSTAEAERALRATIAVLGERLTDDEAEALASRLPGQLERVLDASEYDGDFDAAEFYERVRRRENTGPGVAKEHADIALRAIGAALDEETCIRLRRALPEPIGRLFLAAEEGTPPPYADAERPGRRTLATGRPGSRHPLSEASPFPAHTHSVARSDDPHAETKLSSAAGLTQERLRESLATGRAPGPERTIADATDE
jgi:uncharacterized protein (DUF2267 family)